MLRRQLWEVTDSECMYESLIMAYTVLDFEASIQIEESTQVSHVNIALTNMTMAFHLYKLLYLVTKWK